MWAIRECAFVFCTHSILIAGLTPNHICCRLHVNQGPHITRALIRECIPPTPKKQEKFPRTSITFLDKARWRDIWSQWLTQHYLHEVALVVIWRSQHHWSSIVRWSSPSRAVSTRPSIERQNTTRAQNRHLCELLSAKHLRTQHFQSKYDARMQIGHFSQNPLWTSERTIYI